MAYTTWTDDHSNTYSEPYIPSKIVGFHGIDPDLVSSGGSGGGSGIDDHEQLRNLLGGDSRGHYHMTDIQFEWLTSVFLDIPFAHSISSAASLNALIDARIEAALTARGL